MITYQKDGVDIKTTYTVEYIDNQRDADYVNSGRIDKGEPWERYKKKEFTDADKAFSLYMVMLVREDIYDVQLFESVYLNGELVREQYVEGVPTLRYSLKTAVNRLQEIRLDRLQDTNDTLSEEVKIYQSFIDKYNAKSTFEKFRDDTNREAAS